MKPRTARRESCKAVQRHVAAVQQQNSIDLLEFRDCSSKLFAKSLEGKIVAGIPKTISSEMLPFIKGNNVISRSYHVLFGLASETVWLWHTWPDSQAHRRQAPIYRLYDHRLASHRHRRTERGPAKRPASDDCKIGHDRSNLQLHHTPTIGAAFPDYDEAT